VVGLQQMVHSSFRDSSAVSQGEEKAKQWLEGIKAIPKVYPKNTAIVEALSRVKLPLALSITTTWKVQARKSQRLWLTTMMSAP